jgi:dTDP-4-amino-4,6-dideoxy-D-galactose acyltransferase
VAVLRVQTGVRDRRPVRSLTFLPWDTEFFGFPVGRLDGSHDGPDGLSDALQACAQEGIRCAYCQVPVDQTAAVRAVEEGLFHLVDVRVTLHRPVDRSVPGPDHPIAGAGLRVADEPDIPVLESIAAVSHIDSRFYADPGFPRDRCAQLYRTWIANSCRGWAAAVLVEGPPGAPTGYVTCHVEGRTGEIGLIAVHESARRTGVGQRLVAGALSWFAEAGLSAVTVATQGRNIGAQRLYQHHGFRTQQVGLWYHKWFAG